MKHIFLLLALTILNACSPSPQVTVTSEVTVTLTPPPTLTPTPIVVDGIAEDAKGNKLAYLNGEWIILPELEGDFRLMADKDGIRAVDSDGKVVYEYDMATGAWLEAISEAMQAAEQHFADLGYPTDDVEYIEGEVNIRGIVEGRTVFTMNIESGEFMFDQDYAEKQAGQQELMPTDIEPRGDVLNAQGITAPADRELANSTYFHPQFDRIREQFIDQFGYEIPYEVGLKRVMIDSDILAWETIIFNPKDVNAQRYLAYELGDRVETDFVYILANGEEVVGGTILIVPLMPEK